MEAGNIVLIDLIQPDGGYKLRPALILKELPKYRDYLVCGISSQLHQYISDIDEVLDERNAYFNQTGLRKASLIRLLFLAVVSDDRISGSVGKIPVSLHKDLLQRLSGFITG